MVPSAMRETSQKRLRAISAWCCLLATLLLFAPYAEAAWSAHAAACCTGDHCPIPEHHHSKNRVPFPTHTQDCEHQAGDSMSNCSMSCCEKTERMLLAAMTFVLPLITVVTASDDFSAAAPVLQVNNFLRSIEVLSPPPRS
jgi:hypothetical protein